MTPKQPRSPVQVWDQVDVHAITVRVVPERSRFGRWQWWRLPDPRDMAQGQTLLGDTWPGESIPDDPERGRYEDGPIVARRVRLRRLPCPPTRGIVLGWCWRLEGEEGGHRPVRLIEVALRPPAPHRPCRLVRVWPGDDDHPPDLTPAGCAPVAHVSGGRD